MSKPSSKEEINIHISPCCSAFTVFHPVNNQIDVKCNICKQTCYTIKDKNIVIKNFVNGRQGKNADNIIANSKKILQRSLYDETLPYYALPCKVCNSKQKCMIIDGLYEIVMCINPSCKSHTDIAS